MTGTRRNTLALFILGAVLAVPLSLAQTHDDEDALAEEERRYLERQLRQARGREAGPEPGRASDPVADFLAEADRLVRDRNYGVSTSAHYEVKTDDPRLDPAAMTRLLESFRTFFDGFWEDRAPLDAYDPRARVYLFYSFYKYNQLLTGQEEFSNFRPTGHYRPLVDVVVIYSDNVVPGELPDILVHEAVHQLVDKRLYVGGHPPSLWISEGLASYFGYTARDESGSFVEGSIGDRTASVLKGGGRSPGKTGRDRLKEIRRALKRNRDWSAADLIQTQDPGVFYGEGVEERYAASWLLVHFLFHGEGGTHADAFVRYLRLESEDRGGPRAFFAELGLSAEELDRRFREHVLGLKG